MSSQDTVTSDDSGLVSTGGAAHICGVSRRTVLRWVEAGHLPGYRTPGGRWRRRRTDVLDFMTREGAQGSKPRPPTGTDRPLLVAIVEDHVHEAEALERLMLTVRPDALVRRAVDGFEAGVLLGRMVPDLLLLDLEIPGLDGVGVMRYAGTRPDLASMEVVVVSGTLTREKERALQEVGVTKLWRKPLDPARVAELLREFGRGARAAGQQVG